MTPIARPSIPHELDLPRHPVTVRVSLTTGAIVVQGLDRQIAAIEAALAAAGIELVVESAGLCG